MKNLLFSFFFAAAILAPLGAQTLVNVQKSGAPSNAISGDLTFGSGRTLTLATGSHLVLASGTFSPSAGSINWTALTGQPTTLAGYGITDPVVLTSGSYANPSWVTSLASSKLTGSISSLLLPAFSGDATSSAGSSVLTLAASGVTLGTYGSATAAPVITFDAKGRATSASLVTITPAFSSLTGKPTTAAGYGITNGANLDLWGAKTVPSGTIADLSSVQVFTNKSLSGAANTFTLIPTSAFSGALLAANFPALTGDVTTTSGSLATSYAGVVPASKGGAGSITGLLKANGSGTVSAAVSGTDYAPAGNYITALTGDVSASGPGSAAATVTKLNGTSLAGLTTGLLKNTTSTGVPTIAVAGTDYQTPLTFSTGLTNSTGTVTVNTSQNIAKLSNLTTNGFVKTGSGDGTLSIDTSTYITGNQTITLSGDASGSGTTSIAVTNTKLNGVSLAGLATGLLKNTTSTGVPSIAAAGTDYVAPGGAGSISGLTNHGAVYASGATSIASTAALTNGQILVGSTSASPVAATLTGTANQITVTNGAGSITLSTPSSLDFTGKTVTGGTLAPSTIDAPIGSVSPSTGSFTTVGASGLVTISKAVAQLDLVDTTASGSAWSLRSGLPLLGDLSVYENGIGNWMTIKKTTGSASFLGGINGTSIGATTPSAGSFTTASATGDLTLSGTTGTSGHGYIQGPTVSGKGVTLQWNNSTGFFNVRDETATQQFLVDSSGEKLSANLVVGTAANGTGTGTGLVAVQGGSGTGGGAYISFVKNSVASGFVGHHSAIFGTGTSSDIDVYSGSSNVNIYSNGSSVATFSPTGLSTQGLKVDTGGTIMTKVRHGTATLVGGSVTVTDAAVTANTRIFVTSQVDGGTPGWLRVSTRTAATNFVITSSNILDTSTVGYLEVEP